MTSASEPEQDPARRNLMAQRFVGLTEGEAVALADDLGFHLQVIGESITLDFNSGRVRVRLGEDGRIVQVWMS